MSTGIYLPLTALPIVFLLTIVLNIKTKIKNYETKIYNFLLISNIFGLLLEILCSYASSIYYSNYFLSIFILKSYLVYLLIWTALFSQYVYIISTEKIKRIFTILNIFLIVISIIVISILKIDLVQIANTSNYYTSGLCAYFSYGVSFIYTLIISFLVIKNIKKIKDKRYLPIIFFFFIGTMSIAIQIINPRILLLTWAESLICFIMYFTIENPDAKLVEKEKNLKDAEIASSLAKSEFLASMSHELRTPLNAIIGLSEDIESFKNDIPVDVHEDSTDIVTAGNTLLELIGNILDISKIESGKLEIVDTYYSPSEDFMAIVKLIRTKLGDKPIAFNVNLSPLLPRVLYGDKLRIKQIVMNILDNAIKYTDSGSVVFTSNWLSESNSLEIVVADTGRGIKKELMDRLFGEYDRLDAEKITSEEGTGLGLSITKNLVTLMNGTIKVDSEYRKGTVFRILIPQVIGSEEEYEKLKEQSSFVPIELDFSGKKLLIVDDNELNVKVLRKAIKNYNFEVDEAHNGQECLDKVNAGNTYDLILLDIMMPIMGGEETIKNLKSKEGFNTPVLALTADALGGAKEKYMNMGFDDYLSKPFSRNIIAQKLNLVFNGKK